MNTKLYFAYGSNLNIAQMKRRCPKAKPLRRWKLGNARLVFRGVADCILDEGAACYGGIWLITPECERALDAYEGFRRDDPEAGMYRKIHMPLPGPMYGGHAELMYYAMNSTGIMPPSGGYLACIVQGYRDFKLPLRPLHEAVTASHDDKNPSHIERQRYRRNGRPRLALASEVPLKKRTA